MTNRKGNPTHPYHAARQDSGTMNLWDTRERVTATIEFDGGTSCNIPSLGFGDGYGSFRINNGPLRRVRFDRPMSNNAAEISTMAAAIRSAKEHGATALVLIGDSQIALNWANRVAGNAKRKHNGNMSDAMRLSIIELRECMSDIADLETKWQPRLRSVATFGH
jgi:ribonuclease HI